MTRIEVHSLFALPVKEVFDAERNISLHASTQEHRGERAIAGVTSGLIEAGEEVEWEAVHFGLRQRLRVRITAMQAPFYFRDEMVSGAFKSFVHEHHFLPTHGGQTLKKDVLYFAAPLGPIGWVAEKLFLRSYLTRFLKRKNAELKKLVEAKN